MHIVFYKKSNHKIPVIDFIQGLITEDKAKIFSLFKAIEKHGFETQRIKFKPFAGVKNLWEMKIKGKGGIYRIFYIYQKKDTIVLLHAFQKKTQKTPITEKEIAVKRLKEVLNNE